MTTTAAPVLQLVDVGVSYGSTRALAGVDLEVAPGELLSVVGPSGCGKSSLLRAVAGLVDVDAGRVLLQGREVASPRASTPPERRGVSVVFQDLALFPHLDVADNVAFGLRRGRGRRGRRREETAGRVAEVLDLVGLTDKAARFPHELSGGEQQRVALARALAPDPLLVLLDEPFSHLDRGLAAQVRQEATALLRDAGATVVLVTHDQDEALGAGDRVAVLSEGRVRQVGSPAAVFHTPRSRFVATFLGEADFLPGDLAGDGTATTALGRLPVRRTDEGASAPTGPAGPLDVMVRPHDLTVEADADGPGTVVRSEFRGGSVLQHVRLPQGQVVRALVPHTAEVPVGTRARLRVLADHPLALVPHDGRA